MKRSPTGQSAPASSKGTNGSRRNRLRAHFHAPIGRKRKAQVFKRGERSFVRRTHIRRGALGDRDGLRRLQRLDFVSSARQKVIPARSCFTYALQRDRAPLDDSCSRWQLRRSAGLSAPPCVSSAAARSGSRAALLALIRRDPGTRRTTSPGATSPVAATPRHPSRKSAGAHDTASTPSAMAHVQTASSTAPAESMPPNVIGGAIASARTRVARPRVWRARRRSRRFSVR